MTRELPQDGGPQPDFYWDDIVLGRSNRSTLYRVTEEELVAFARRYDPLPIHVDRDAATAGPFGALTAPGSLILAIRQRLLHDFTFPAAVIASIGHDEVRFVSPLFADQQCQVEVEFIEKRASSKRADRGVAIIATRLFADDRLVLTLKDIALMRRRCLSVQGESAKS